MANRLNTHPVNPEILKILIQTMNYRQGSIAALVKQNGTVSERFSYDAWGRRRNPANWADYNVPAPRLIARGYTGHEHLDGFGLINMNGRMYDPVIGRVLSPDNYVQDPTNTQSYNRYSYCLNNPLRYTDPSGWFAAAADQYWNMGKDITDFISFSGRRASSADGTGGGQGWGGNGGVVPQGIHWMPKSMPKGVTVDDLMGSLWEATPFDGKQYNYDNVDGDWYNTSTTTFIFDNQGAGTSVGDAISAAGDDESIFTINVRGYGLRYGSISINTTGRVSYSVIPKPKNAQELFNLLYNMRVGESMEGGTLNEQLDGITLIRYKDGFNIKLPYFKEKAAGAFGFDPNHRFTIDKVKWVDGTTDIIRYRESHNGVWGIPNYIHNDGVRYRYNANTPSYPYKFGNRYNIGDGKW